MLFGSACTGLRESSLFLSQSEAALKGDNILPNRSCRTERHVATINASDLLGVSDRGLLEKGKLADIIAVHGDPLKDVRVLEDVTFVMKGGTVYKRRP